MAHNWTYYYTRLGHADHIQKIYMYLKTGSSLLYLVSFDSEISSTRNYCDWFWVMYFWNFNKYMYCSHFLGLVKCHYKTRTLSKYYNWSIKSYIMGKLKSTKLCLFLCWISLTCAISQGNSQQFKSLITLICSKVFKPELFYIYRYISRKCKL